MEGLGQTGKSTPSVPERVRTQLELFCAAEIEPLFSYVLIFFLIKEKEVPILEFMLNFPTVNTVN